jgi:hypothetical protein
MLDIWPPFPIVIWYWIPESGEDDIVAALEHNTRISKIDLRCVSSSRLENVLPVMQEPFLALTDLRLSANDEVTVISKSFLAGSAPHLRNLELFGIPFLGLPTLLLSATDLVTLHLQNVPHSGYISPEVMVTALSALTRLCSFHLVFKSPRSRPVQQSRRLPPRTRTILPALTHLKFKGVSEYLEDLVAWIDAPLLDKLDITFFHQLIFDTSQLARFISRSPNPMTRNKAHVTFENSTVRVTLPQILHRQLTLDVSCTQSDWQLSSLRQVCNSLSPISFFEHLYIDDDHWNSHWQGDIENAQWLELLQPFVIVKGLYLSRGIAPRILPALQELVGGGTAEVLPALQSLFLEEHHPSEIVQEAVERFVSARRLSGLPIAVSHWKRVHSWW